MGVEENASGMSLMRLHSGIWTKCFFTLSVGGCLPTFDVFLLVFLVLWEENTGESPWWKSGFLAVKHLNGLDTEPLEHRGHAPTLAWTSRQGQKFRLMLTAQLRAMYHLTVTGVYCGTFVIFTGCVEADRVTHVFFCNSTALETLARFDVRRAVVIQPG